MTNNRKVICAGCLDKFYIDKTQFHRKKRWCGSEFCKEQINDKVKNSNYKKAQKKIEKGTFRHGVNEELRKYIKDRDDLTCRLCIKQIESYSSQVHHIVPVSYGGDDAITNLILLCSNCHTKVHQKGWELYVNKFTTYTNKMAKVNN